MSRDSSAVIPLVIFALNAGALAYVDVHSSFRVCAPSSPAASCYSPASRQQVHRTRPHVCTTTMDNSFRTEVDIPVWPQHTQLGYADSFFLIGSCFSDNVGSRLRQAKLQTAINPSHGLLFSPLSVCDSIDRMASGPPYREDDPGIVFGEGKGLWSSLDHHSAFDSASRYAYIP